MLVLAVALGLARCGGATRGVAPQDEHLYAAKGGMFRCIGDPSIVIPFDRVNDDYCDCPDGSDEPGTAACANGRFWCAGSAQYIPSRLVGDGACDYEVCCDGSDEAPGVCEDRCAEVRAKQERAKEEERKYAQEGARLRTGLEVAAAKRERELCALVAEQQRLISKLPNKIGYLHAEIEQAGSTEMSEPLQAVRNSMQRADAEIAALQAQLASLQAGYAHLDRMLATMSAEYNPNFNDPAVKAAIKEWREHARPDVEPISHEAVAIDDMLEAVERECSGECVPSGWIGKLVQLVGLETSAASGGLRGQRLAETLAQRESELAEAQKMLQLYSKLLEMGTEFWGPKSIGRALEETCVSVKRGDFTYEACLFGTAVQLDGVNEVQLGRSQGLKVDDGFYVDFKGGNRCPNRVERSARVLISCGHVTEAYSVEEPEVCHYEIRIRSPIACVVEEDVKDEL